MLKKQLVNDALNTSIVCGIADCPGPSSEIARPDDQQVILIFSIELNVY